MTVIATEQRVEARTNYVRGADVDLTAGNAPIQDYSVKSTRTVDAGNAGTLGATFVAASRTQAATRQQTWNIYSFVDDYSDPQELFSNVKAYSFTGAAAVYAKAYKNASAPIWGGVFEVKDKSNDPHGPLYGIEVSIQADTDDIYGHRRGIAVFYGTVTDGKVAKQFAGVHVAPIFGQPGANLHYGMMVDGSVVASYASGASGYALLYGAGSYGGGAVKLDDVKNTPFSLVAGDGTRLKFRTDVQTGPPGVQTWHPRTAAPYTPNWAGVLEVVVDATTLYLPVAANRP